MNDETENNQVEFKYDSATFCEICSERLNYNKKTDYIPSLCKACVEKHIDDTAVSMGTLVEAGDGFAEITP